MKKVSLRNYFIDYNRVQIIFVFFICNVVCFSPFGRCGKSRNRGECMNMNQLKLLFDYFVELSSFFKKKISEALGCANFVDDSKACRCSVFSSSLVFVLLFL